MGGSGGCDGVVLNAGFNGFMYTLVHNSKGSKMYTWHLEMGDPSNGLVGSLGIF